MADSKKEQILRSKDGKVVIRVTENGIQVGKGVKNTRKRLPRLVTFPLFVGALATGGYLDMANNTRDASTENSNPVLTAQYEQRIAELAELRGQGQDVRMQSIDLLQSVWVNNQLSEADVKTLTDQFTAQVKPPAMLPGGLVLERPEYLDEVKAQTTSRDLATLDRMTMQMHEKHYNDGPWAGILLGWLAYIVGIGMANKGYASASSAIQRRRENKPKPKKPSGPYGRH
ncbi:MAG: hypothetical protein EA357_08550 [Micavibrio sp.]|nr:MAG: hypothetical protein EA357_08550 [Micavibrio sp.]